MVPVNGIGLVIPHSGQEDASCLSLFEDVPNGPACPIAIGSEIKRILSDR